MTAVLAAMQDRHDPGPDGRGRPGPAGPRHRGRHRSAAQRGGRPWPPGRRGSRPHGRPLATGPGRSRDGRAHRARRPRRLGRRRFGRRRARVGRQRRLVVAGAVALRALRLPAQPPRTVWPRTGAGPSGARPCGGTATRTRSCTRIAQRFEGAYPYLQLIASENGRRGPARSASRRGLLAGQWTLLWPGRSAGAPR